MDIDVLKKLGFSDKSAKVYLALLSLGPSSVRVLAERADLNRGSTYDALKWLQDQGVVSFYKQEKKQFFVAESPGKLEHLLQVREEELKTVERKLEKVIPELRALYDSGGARPVARYFDKKGLKDILEDVLETTASSDEKVYRIYSAEGLRKYLYKDFPSYSDARVAKGISVQVIALGKGGELRGLDERKWIEESSETPTYIMIYPGKTAYISLNGKGEPVGVVIENQGVYETQRLIFDRLWNSI